MREVSEDNENYYFLDHDLLLSLYTLFRALLFGGLRESHQAEVEIKDTNLTAFKVLLKYIYTGWVSLGSEKVSARKVAFIWC